MKTIRGPGLSLAQFAGAAPPFDNVDAITERAATCGYAGVQVPTFVPGLVDLDALATTTGAVEDLEGRAAAAGVEITELAAHMQGQLVAVHPAYDEMFAGFAPEAVRGDRKARQSRAEDKGVDVCFALHPGEDLHDGITFGMLLDRVDRHPRCRLLYDPSHVVPQGLDYPEHIDIYAERIGMFHVEDAEFRPTGRQGDYGGYQGWVDRVGRFRRPGDGQVDFGAVFSKLTAAGFDGRAVVAWDCAPKHSGDGAREGAAFTRDRIVRKTDKAFDDVAGGAEDDAMNRRLLGLEG